MAGQREFPFFVNGQYWHAASVNENIIHRGHMEFGVMSKMRCDIIPSDEMPDMMAKMKHVRFQLVECAEQKHGMVARWQQGFWLCDDEVYLEEGNIYMKEKVEV